MFSKVDIGNGTFALVAVHSNQCLTLDDWGNAYWATLLQDYCNFSPQVLRRQAWTAHGPDNPNDADMVTGYLDGWYANSTGIGVWGWALTPQAPAHPLGYRTTVNGTVVTPGGLRYGGSTHRPDVNSYWNWGYHNESGYNFLEPYVLPLGTHNVCVQAQSWGYWDNVACRTMAGAPPTPDPVWLYPDPSGVFFAQWAPSAGATGYRVTITDQVSGSTQTQVTSSTSASFTVNTLNRQKVSVFATNGGAESAAGIDFAEVVCTANCDVPDDSTPSQVDESVYEPGAAVVHPPLEPQVQFQGQTFVSPSPYAVNPHSVCWGTGIPGIHTALTQIGPEILYNERPGKVTRLKLRCGDNGRGVNHISYRTTQPALYLALNKHFGRVFDAQTLALIRYVFAATSSPYFPVASKTTSPSGNHVLTRKTGCLQLTPSGPRVLWSHQVRVIVNPVTKEIVSAYLLGNGPEDRTAFAVLYPQKCRGLPAPT